MSGFRQVRCPRCGQSVQIEIGTGYLTPHYWQGAVCTEETRPRPRRGYKPGSARSVSGGLPTLGRGHR